MKNGRKRTSHPVRESVRESARHLCEVLEPTPGGADFVWRCPLGPAPKSEGA
jgi:hypothetical protein